MNERPKKGEQIGIRVTSELRQKIREEADALKRSESNFITIILEEYFENKDRLKKIAEKK